MLLEWLVLVFARRELSDVVLLEWLVLVFARREIS